MAMQRALHELLFWSTLLIGGLSMATCLVLPAWIERELAFERVEQMRGEVSALQRELQAVVLQIAHHRRDPEYNERFVRQEYNVTTPNVEVWDLAPWTGDATALPAPEPELRAAPTRARRWVDAVEQAARAHPSLSIFLLSQTRPFVMVFSGVLLVAAIALLVAGPPPARPRDVIVI